MQRLVNLALTSFHAVLPGSGEGQVGFGRVHRKRGWTISLFFNVLWSILVRWEVCFSGHGGGEEGMLQVRLVFFKYCCLAVNSVIMLYCVSVS
jgi:hypothetical protein